MCELSLRVHQPLVMGEGVGNEAGWGRDLRTCAWLWVVSEIEIHCAGFGQ